MKKFDYNEYNNIVKALDDYYESIGFDDEPIWEIRNHLTDLYNQMKDDLDIDENHAIDVIMTFVEKCIEFQDAFYYPISIQECLEALILIAFYPFDGYETVKQIAYSAAHAFHTFINHNGK